MASPETVRVYVQDQNEDPLVGVLVRFFDETGTIFISQEHTALIGGEAYAEVTLDGDDPPIAYTIRLAKMGVAFDGSLGEDSKATQEITIYSPPSEAPSGNNWFLVQGQTFVVPTATDPRLCRASGFFRDAAGRPYANLDIFLIAKFKPAIVDGAAVMGERVDLRTDEDGFAQVDLFRNGEYLATVQSLEDITRQIFVPDRASINLPDLIFPVVKSIVWDPDEVDCDVGDIVEVVPTVTASDYHVLAGTAIEDVLYEVEDPTIATVQCLTDKLIITGVSAGTTQLKATRLDQTVVVVPNTEIDGYLLDIMVV